MRYINRRHLFLPALLACMALLCGCREKAALTDKFSADRPGFEVQIPDESERGQFAYFAEEFCVAYEDVEKIEADTSEAMAACFFRLDTKEVLYARNVHERLYPASTTKIMTALITLKSGDLDAQATVSQTAVTFKERGATTARLKAGDVLSVRQLLHALLLPSANDAANVIAEKVGGSMEAFVELMNAEAQRLGATNTHFVNPSGLHDEDHYTTVYDLYLIFQEAMKYEEFLEILRLPEYKTNYRSADGASIEGTWSSSNQFTKGAATVPDGVRAVGGKTGTTAAAKSCLVQLFEDSGGGRYAAIILGCSDRGVLYEEMQTFLASVNSGN